MQKADDEGVRVVEAMKRELMRMEMPGILSLLLLSQWGYYVSVSDNSRRNCPLT